MKLENKNLSQLKKQADKVFSIFIRDRDSNICITCGKRMERRESQAGHYIKRNIWQLRYDEKNVNCQCVGCNVFKKGNYTVYALKMIEKHGDNILYDLDEIKRKAHANVEKLTREFLINIIKTYE